MLEEKTKKETVLNTLFECREESLYALTEKDKERIATLTKDTDSYEKLFSIIEDMKSPLRVGNLYCGFS